MVNNTISVIMSNYNHAKYIDKALEAILSQSYRPMEVILVDDATTDNSVEIIKQFIRQDQIIRIVVNEKNIGTVRSTQKLLDFVRGDYV